MIKINLLVIATNKYTQFLEPLFRSADEFFLKDCEVTYNVFTNENWFDDGTYNRRIVTHKIEHEEWPMVTLHRFHSFRKNMDKIPKGDYYFYVDADTLFKAPIQSHEILSDVTATRHCGFTGKRGSYETNPKSICYVAENEGTRYYGGGFYGMKHDLFWNLVFDATRMIDIDFANGIIPVWHDESVLNRILIDNPPTKVLSPSYHYPEGKIEYYRNMWGRDYECKILLLDKNHNEIRK